MEYLVLRNWFPWWIWQDELAMNVYVTKLIVLLYGIDRISYILKDNWLK